MSGRAGYKRGGWKQGKYVVKNPRKYVGDINKVRYLSSWELDAHKFFDTDSRILKWSSEPVRIYYLKPTDRKRHYYLPDYWIRYRDRNGKLVEELVELKPSKQLAPSRSKNPRRRLYENRVHAVNTAKWAAAKRYAAKRGWRFRFITERDILR